MTRASIKELKIGDWPYFVRPLGCRDGQQPTRVALTLFLPKRAILLLLRDSRRARQAWYPVKAQQPRSKAAVCVCVGNNNRRDGTRTTSYLVPINKGGLRPVVQHCILGSSLVTARHSECFMRIDV